MIGAFYIAEQYLQRVAGFSALGAAAALVLVALLVGAAAPLAGALVDRRGEQLPTLLGFIGAGLGLVILGLPGVSLDSLVTVLPLIPVGLGLGMLFVPTSRAALNASPLASHGRTSALLSVGRLLGAAVGAGLAGIALSGTPDRLDRAPRPAAGGRAVPGRRHPGVDEPAQPRRAERQSSRFWR